MEHHVRTRLTGIPKGVPIITSGRYDDARFKGHEDYALAKAGDSEAAVRFVTDLVAAETLARARELFKPETIFSAPMAAEQSGDNAIPKTLAALYAAETGGHPDRQIVQATRAYHTGAKMMERLLARVYFDGEVVPDAPYVLVDDVTTGGSTLAWLADHIDKGGGKVVGVITLAQASRSGELVPTRSTIATLEARGFGEVIREQFGIEPGALTADEAQYLVGFRDAEQIRNRAAKASRERADRLRAKGIL